MDTGSNSPPMEMETSSEILNVIEEDSGETSSYEQLSDSESQMSESSLDMDMNTDTESMDDTSSSVAVKQLDPGFEGLELRAKEGDHILGQLKEILSRYPGVNGTWLDQVREVEKWRKTDQRVIIGVVGSTGAGKSSVINAMLDEERLVPTSSMRACTAVVTELSYNTRVSKYHAEIEFISRRDWEEQLHILYQDIQDGDEASGAVPNDNSDFSVACAKFKAVYGMMPKDIVKTTVEKLLNNKMVSEVLGTTLQFASNDATQFYNKIQSYVDSKERNGRDKGAAKKGHKMELWPLVQLVRLRVKSPVLSTGAVIVDLPGLSDFNSARGTIARSYIEKCSAIWVVAPITRAIDDHTARTLLGENFKRQLQLDGGFKRVTFICSKTDDINLTETADALDLSEEEGDFGEFCDLVKKKISRLQSQIQAADSQKAQIIKQLKGPNNTIYRRGTRPDTNTATSSNFVSPQKRKASSQVDCEVEESEGVAPTNDDKAGNESTGEAKGLPATRRGLLEKKGRIIKQVKFLKEQIRTHKKEKQEREVSYGRRCILGRNNFSRSSIQEDFALGIQQLDATNEEISAIKQEPVYRDYDTIKNSLPVFCISSRAYQKFQGRFKRESAAKGFQTVEDTEIPQLQRHCRLATSRAHAASYNNFLKGLDQLLNSFAIQSSSYQLISEDKRQEDREYLQTKLGSLNQLLQRSVDDFSTNYIAGLQEGLFDILDLASKSAALMANSAVERWNIGLAWGTYKAICRRSGHYRNRVQKFAWNTELTETMISAVAPKWERTFTHQIPRLLTAFEISCSSLINDFTKEITADLQSIAASQPLSQNLNEQLTRYLMRLGQISVVVASRITSAQKRLNRTFTPAVEGSLRSAYVEVVNCHGKGSYKVMKETMFRHVNESRHHMFKNIVKDIRAELKNIGDHNKRTLLDEVEEIVNAISRDYTAHLEKTRGVEEQRLKDELMAFIKHTTEANNQASSDVCDNVIVKPDPDMAC